MENTFSLNETDQLLTEKEQSLKKKIFSLGKMEALIFSDPKLTSIYDQMMENGTERYGYHANETVNNLIFNDYVLNSPKYLQKYKMAIPHEKKRRDKSGINQLRKTGEKTMKYKDPQFTPQSANETTGAGGGGAGAFAPALGYTKQVAETTTAGGGGAGAYVGPAAWGGGDLMKGGKSDAMRKPIWQGGTIIQESTNYLIDTSGFEKYVESLNEQIGIEDPHLSQENNVQPDTNAKVNNYIGDNTNAFTNTNIKQWGKDDTNLELNTINTGVMNQANLDEIENNSKISTVDQLKQITTSGQKITKEIIPSLAGEALYTIAIQLANRIMPIDWDDLSDSNSMWDYINKNGGMSYEQLTAAVNKAVNVRLKNDGMKNGELYEKAVSQKQQRFMGMVDAVQSGKLSPNKVGGDVEKAANNMKNTDVKDYASTSHNGLPEKAKNKVLNELSLQDAVEYVSDRKGEVPFTLGGVKWEMVNAKYPDGRIDVGVYRFGHDIVYDYETWRKEMNINETDQSMIGDKQDSMSNKPMAAGTVSAGGVPVGMNDTGMNESLLEEINNELNAYSIHHDKLKKMSEERKPSALVLRDRVGAENITNFKKDLQHSGTKDIINVEKELMWKDQQTDVGEDPQKLSQDIEKTGLKANKGEAFENVGNSTNENGKEVTKRNLTTEEQDEVNLYRKGMHSLVYDNKPDAQFEDRMKNDMGDAVYEIREKQLADFGKQPMYNKDPQPTAPTTSNKVQFNKEQSGWNERTGLKESMISGRYANALNKKHIIDFNLNEALALDENHNIDDLFVLDFTGLGNAYNSKTIDNKVTVNESVINVLAENKFYTDGKDVYAVKNPVQKLNETEVKQATMVNEEVNKMKHLLGYKPATYTSTKNIKL